MLDEAIAVLECELNIAPGVRVQSGLIDQDWKGKRARIRAAVRDVALAAAECKLGSENAKRCIGSGGGPMEKDCVACVKAEIDRLLPEKGAKDAG